MEGGSSYSERTPPMPNAGAGPRQKFAPEWGEYLRNGNGLFRNDNDGALVYYYYKAYFGGNGGQYHSLGQQRVQLRNLTSLAPCAHASTVRRHAPRHAKATRSSAAIATASPASAARS